MKTEIYEIRKKAKLTQREFAKLVGISYTYISYLENGYKEPSRALITRIKDFCRERHITFKMDAFI